MRLARRRLARPLSSLFSLNSSASTWPGLRCPVSGITHRNGEGEASVDGFIFHVLQFGVIVCGVSPLQLTVKEGLELVFGLNVTAEDHETVAGFKLSLVLLEGVEKAKPGIVEIHD